MRQVSVSSSLGPFALSLSRQFSIRFFFFDRSTGLAGGLEGANDKNCIEGGSLKKKKCLTLIIQFDAIFMLERVVSYLQILTFVINYYTWICFEFIKMFLKIIIIFLRLVILFSCNSRVQIVLRQ